MGQLRPQRSRKRNPLSPGVFFGASRTRTGDLLGAIQALSQLSYSPAPGQFSGGVSDFSIRRRAVTVAVEAVMTPIISRGFRGRRRDEGPPDRVPPGQYLTDDFPVLSAGPTPHTPLEQWDFTIVGEVDELHRWTWEEFRALPSEEVTVDIHCVTKWSKLDTTWQGVAVDTLLEGVETSAEYARRLLRRRLHDEPSARGRPRREGVGRLLVTTASRSTPSTAGRRGCSSRTCTSGRARSGYGASDWPRRTSPASGNRTATTSTATRGGNSGTGATDLASGGGRRGRSRDAARQDASSRRSRLARPPARAARRRPADGRGRLPGTAQLLDRLPARRGARSS